MLVHQNRIALNRPFNAEYGKLSCMFVYVFQAWSTSGGISFRAKHLIEFDILWTLMKISIEHFSLHLTGITTFFKLFQRQAFVNCHKKANKRKWRTLGSKKDGTPRKNEFRFSNFAFPNCEFIKIGGASVANTSYILLGYIDL